LHLPHPAPLHVGRVVVLLVAGDLAGTAADAAGHVEVEPVVLSAPERRDSHCPPPVRARLEILQPIQHRSRGALPTHSPRGDGCREVLELDQSLRRHQKFTASWVKMKSRPGSSPVSRTYSPGKKCE